jgi:hypothetical protein
VTARAFARIHDPADFVLLVSARPKVLSSSGSGSIFG